MADREYGNDRDRLKDYDERDRNASYGRNRDDARDWNDRNQDRGAMARGTDEVRSWFGDDEARRRREMDERRDREHDRFQPEDRSRWSGERNYTGGSRDSWSGGNRSENERGYSSGREWGGDRYPSSESRWQNSRYTQGSDVAPRRDYGSPGYGSGFGSDREFSSNRGDFGANRGGDFGSGANRPSDFGMPRGGYDSAANYGRDNWSTSGGQSSGYGGQSWRDTGSSRGSFAGRGPRNFQRSDERIREDVVDRLTEDPRIDASDIDVEVRNGEVFLRGKVDERRTRRTAEECIENIPGVRDVKNELQVERSGGWFGSREDDRNRSGNEDRNRHEDVRARDGSIGHGGNPEVRDDVTSLNITGPQSEATKKK